MNPARKSLQWMVWGGLVLTITAIVAAFIIQRSREHRSGSDWKSIIGYTDIPGKAPPVLFAVPDFTLTNQGGQVVTRSNLLGQVWLADIIFTRCAGPCPEMTRRMAELQSTIPSDLPVKFVTLTTDPDNDTPAVLQSYARRFLAQSGRWHFLTGTKKQIADLAVSGLKLTALEKEADKRENLDDLFIHSTLFVLIDPQGRARAVFESDDPAMKTKLLPAIMKLLQEK
jgi:cytochrome oxidase Cu insertion factor (SCO1/SenC/PrrC family)